MIDGIKIFDLSILPENIVMNPRLVFPLPVNEKDGDVLKIKRTAYYRSLKFVIIPEILFTDSERVKYRSKVQLFGSLHKYKNSGRHNYDDFSYSQLLQVIIDLYNKFRIHPQSVNLNGLEFGVNISVPFDPSQFIDDLLTHRTKTFSVQPGQKKHIAVAIYQRYVLKIYNKGLQHGIAECVLRIEIKVLKMIHLKKLDIKTLWDIIQPDKLEKLKVELVRCFGELIYYDSSIQLLKVSNKDASILRAGNNPKIWGQLKNEKGPNWNKWKDRFKNLVNKHGSHNYLKIEDYIQKKWESSCRISERDRQQLSEFENQLQSEPNAECKGLADGYYMN